MTDAFKYRPRRGNHGYSAALVGSTVQLDEQIEYLLCFPNPCPPPVVQRLKDLGGELIREDTAVLNVVNFVGVTDLAGVALKIISSKIGEDGVCRILQEVSELASSLIFGWRRPIHFGASIDDSHAAPVPYHQLQFLRRSMLEAKPGERFQDWIETIQRSSTRRFEPERVLLSPDRVRKLDHRAMKETFSRLERLVPVGSGVSLTNNRLAKALTFGEPVKPHLPATISAPRGRLSLDTPENRFVKHVLGECLALVFRFLDHPKLHHRLREDSRRMLGILMLHSSTSFFDEVGALSAFYAPSQALIKAEGYRQVFVFWDDLGRHMSLPCNAAETQRLLEGRDMATLYEYWLFVKILEAAVHVTRRRPVSEPKIYRNELGEILTLGLSVSLGDDITIRFNPTFARSAKTAYSTPLRPDVTVQVDDVVHAFDAKYRIEYLNTVDSDVDDGATTYKRADLYKMHAYRDAIKGMRTAFIAYPGSEFIFFERFGQMRTSVETIALPDGVGAVPLRPADAEPAAKLQALMSLLLNWKSFPLSTN